MIKKRLLPINIFFLRFQVYALPGWASVNANISDFFRGKGLVEDFSYVKYC